MAEEPKDQDKDINSPCKGVCFGDVHPICISKAFSKVCHTFKGLATCGFYLYWGGTYILFKTVEIKVHSQGRVKKKKQSAEQNLEAEDTL